MAPEIWSLGRMDFGTDVFAVGIVICELLTGVHPFAANSEQEMINKIKNEDYNKFPSWIPKELTKLL